MDNLETRTYCDYVLNLDNNNIHKEYHDKQYGFPINDDNELFGRFILEINQAGLSWITILKKQNTFRKSFSNFNIKTISEYGEKDINRLVNDSSIIRNELKINSVIFNAKQTVLIQEEFGSFKKWLKKNKDKNLEEWIILFKSKFKFTGKEITREFLVSTGHVVGAHIKECPIFNKINSC